MSCPRCGADDSQLLPGSAGRAVCRRCGVSVLVPDQGGAVTAAVVERKRVPVLPIFLLLVVGILAGLFLVGRIVYRTLEARTTDA